MPKSTFLLLVLIAACNTRNTPTVIEVLDDLKSEIAEKTSYFDKVRLDSIALSNKYLRIYLTDEIDFASLRQTQIMEWTILPLNNFPQLQIDSVEYNFKMPSRTSGNYEGTRIYKRELQMWLDAYKDPVASSSINAILEENRKSQKYLDYLNFLFAKVRYGRNVVDSAFFGLDALNVVASAVYNYRSQSSLNMEAQILDNTINQSLANDSSKLSATTQTILRPVIDSCRLMNKSE